MKITKGFMKGQVGKIAGATQIGGYFIQKQLEHAAGQTSPAPEGPFFPDEFEPLASVTDLESA
ncbi:MAG: hypothetical protein VKK04_12185 [Synechococcales bacterium]|nr:hypothetical protein [Synechococcales bacterium]